MRSSVLISRPLSNTACVALFLYDQLGCGNSDVPEDTNLWTVSRYLQEVEEVRQGLGLDNFVLYGYSWGGIFAIEYALHYQQHLKCLVISNMTAGTQAYLKRTAHLKQTMLNSDSVRGLRRLSTQKITAS